MCKKRLGTTGTVLLPLHESPPPGDSRSIRPGPGASVRRDWVIPPFLRHDAACFPSSGGAISSDSARMPALFKIRFSRPRDPLNFSVRLTLPDSASLRLRVSARLRVSEGQHAPRAQWIHGHSPKPPAALARAASALGPPPGRGQSESVAVWARWRRVAARHWPPSGPRARQAAGARATWPSSPTQAGAHWHAIGAACRRPLWQCHRRGDRHWHWQSGSLGPHCLAQWRPAACSAIWSDRPSHRDGHCHGP